MDKKRKILLDVEADNIDEIKETETIEVIPENSELKKVIDETKNLLSNEKPKQEKRGRPKGSTNKTPQPELKPVIFPLSPIVNIIIERLPNPIPLTETEKTIIDETGSKVVNKYLTNFAYSEEIFFVVVLIGVLYPRTKQENEFNKKKKN